MYRAVLGQADDVVREARDGSEGIRVFRNTPADVFITDIYMPNGDGFEVECVYETEFYLYIRPTTYL
jgi:YesN/AraC family two-component response regulator